MYEYRKTSVLINILDMCIMLLHICNMDGIRIPSPRDGNKGIVVCRIGGYFSSNMDPGGKSAKYVHRSKNVAK
jgi:hypothetical protein